MIIGDFGGGNFNFIKACNESNYFGRQTKNALIKFQKTNNITPAVGYFGPITRMFVNSILNK